MGCLEGKYSPEEERLLRKMQEPGFREVCALDIVETIRQYALQPSGLVTEKQLIAIQKTLRLQTKGEHLTAFYQKAKVIYDLIISGLLLCKSSAREKAEFLFEIRDVNVVGTLTREELKDLLKQVLSVAYEIIPLLGPLDEDDTHYLNKLHSKHESALTAFISISMYESTTVNKTTFATNISTYEDGKLLTATGVRDFIASIDRGKS